MFIFLFLEWKFCITMESSPNEPIPLTATAYPSFCNMWTITAASVWYLEKNQLKFDYFLWNACSENPLSSTYLRKRVHFLN